MRKILFIGDGVTFTGFSTVLHNIISRIVNKGFDVHHLAINYFGDPHEYNWKIYPAMLGGDIYGINRLKQLSLEQFSGIFILNDMPIIDGYLQTIKSLGLKKIPPIIVYTPIDGYNPPKRFFDNYDIVKELWVYTNFAQGELEKIGIESKVVPHGVNQADYHKMFADRHIAKKLLFQSVKEIDEDSFIVLNGNRNQPRKRIDLTLQGFRLFVEGKPNNVKLYLHCGQKDAGWFIPDLVRTLGLEEKVIMTQSDKSLPQIPVAALNLLYNACDVGVNTAEGEGWGLVNTEHAATGAPQVVANHTSLKELFTDCGLLIDVKEWIFGRDMSVKHGIVSAEDLANKLNQLYTNKELYNELSQKTLEKFTAKEYSWDYIVEEKMLPSFEKLWK